MSICIKYPYINNSSYYYYIVVNNIVSCRKNDNIRSQNVVVVVRVTLSSADRYNELTLTSVQTMSGLLSALVGHH